jgi:hypothetical protein
MPAIFHRDATDTLVEIIPTYPSNLPISGRYVVDFPDHFDLKLNTTKPTRAEVISKISEMMRERFVAFDYFITNNLLSETDFTDNFEVGASQSISVVDNLYLPVSPANPEFNFLNSYKKGTAPNTTSVMGRFPKKNHIEGATITSDRNASGNNCIITQDIDIVGSTNDSLGRNDFFVSFRSALQTYVKDRSLSDTEKNEQNPLTSNRTGYMSYTNTQYDSPNRLRCFISSDGSTYQEVNNLTVFSFNGKVDTIRLAWVNYTDADLTLLSYTLMY